MTVPAAVDLLRIFPKCEVLVIGDFMLDEYVWGHIDRISPEAPVPILKVCRREHTLGGAGNAARNLRGLGARVSVLGVTGADEAGDKLQTLMGECEIDRTGLLCVGARCSTRKARMMSLEHGQQVFRLDEENVSWIDRKTEDALLELAEARLRYVSAVLCSDYLKGVLTERVLQSTFRLARSLGKPVVVAPKDSRPEKYFGADVLIPNAKELAQLARSDQSASDWLEVAAHKIVKELELGSLLVTRGSEGLSLFERSQETLRRTDVATAARSVYDVTGAGDTVVSTFTLAVSAGADRQTAARLANLAAGIVVGKRGTAYVSVEELQHRLMEESEKPLNEEALAAGCGERR